jgi:diguanylate cyclase
MHSDPVEQARKFADEALAAMTRLAIVPSPANYLIWYTHSSGAYPELSKQLRALVDRGEPFTEERLGELHARFFGTGRQARLLDEACERIEVTLGHLLVQVGGLSQDAGSYSDRLENVGNDLDRATPADDLQSMIHEILSETREMQARARVVESELADSSREIEDLRGDLAEAQREANSDGLTGLGNRKHFDAELAIAIDEARQGRTALSVLFADIDHFKAFNDTHGHHVGDQVLRLVAQVLTKSVKGRDVAARYGGEEFAVILPQTGLAGASQLAEQIRQTLAGNRIRLKATGVFLGSITVSIGCAEYQPPEPAGDLMRRVDDALYQAKRKGRNRVVAAPQRRFAS